RAAAWGWAWRSGSGSWARSGSRGWRCSRPRSSRRGPPRSRSWCSARSGWARWWTASCRGRWRRPSRRRSSSERMPWTWRVALRIGFLGALWLPGLALLTAAILPTRTAEIAILVLGSLGLGALVDRFVPWPLAPAVPAAIVFGAHALDLARGSPLIGASLAGPNPKGGARFFGIGNELEILLSLEVLFGLGAALSAVRGRYVPRGFAIGGLIAAAIIGSGRLGADVGGVIT